MRFRNFFLATALVLSGCAQYNSESYNLGANNSGAPQGNAQQLALKQAEKLMRLSQQSKDDLATSYKLQAVEHLIAADSIAQAEQAMQQDFKRKLDATNAAYKQILLAQVELAKQNLSAAQQHLRAIWTPLKLPEDLIVKFYNTRAEISSRSGSLLEAVQERVYLAKHLQTPAERKANNAIILDTLSQFTPNTLRNLQKEGVKDTLNGWLAFTSITKQYDASPEQLMRALTLWKLQYPDHPAQSLIPSNTNVMATTTEENTVFTRTQTLHKPQKIALLLPLQGTHAKAAQAIRDGFLAAYYAQKQDQDKPAISVYDSSVQTNLAELYNQVVAEGADFIVGPLTKEEVDGLSDNIRPEIPVLALNNTSNSEAQTNLFQFSLAPEMEAQAVARKAWQDGHRDALVVIPKSNWGQRVFKAFQNAWHELGGKIIAVEEIQSQSNLTPGVKRLLAIDASEARAHRLNQLGLKFAFDPRRRQDVDMVFIATNAALARQVKPLLNYYFAADLPAYASSSVFTGKPQPTLDQDLNGIQFCDMPWILDPTIGARSTYKAVSEIWSQDFDQYVRLYALGLDAYKIAVQIEQLTLLPNVGISGMTGMLTLDKQQLIQRKLIWAAFKRGKPLVSGEQS